MSCLRRNKPTILFVHMYTDVSTYIYFLPQQSTSMLVAHTSMEQAVVGDGTITGVVGTTQYLAPELFLATTLKYTQVEIKCCKFLWCRSNFFVLLYKFCGCNLCTVHAYRDCMIYTTQASALCMCTPFFKLTTLSRTRTHTHTHTLILSVSVFSVHIEGGYV